ncbi:pseudouridine synthase [Labilibaculum sp.]|uniref:pseudouridine synthase n=1 Tax=Labilibaculum sp. TaxID=2060723 RepID=UPI003562B2EE
MEEKKYGKERREKSSFGSKKENDRKPANSNPRFKKENGSRNNEGRSENPRQRRSDSEKPFHRDHSKSSSSKSFDDRNSERGSERRKSRFKESDRKSGRDSESRYTKRDDRSENSDRQRGDSRSRSPRRFDDNRTERDSDRRRHRSDQSSYRLGRDSASSNRGDERSEFKEKRRFSDDADENQDSSKRFDRFENKPNKETLQKKHYSKKKQLAYAKLTGPEDGMLRLNKYISNTGACSRREADKRIADGRITVNGEIVKEVGTKVNVKDTVCMDGKQLQAEAKVYLVLNKPKDFVTTLDDPLGRKTVLDLIKNACSERVYPVGRLDRMTTGVLLFTNDGDLTKRLTHPSYNKKKIYHAFLNRPISQEELDQVSTGLELEDGEIKADAISFADANDKTQVGIEIHSGKNRIVRRIFEHLGYEVEKLDRVFFAGITKKNIPRGKWRFLSEKEVQMLKIY